MSKMGISTISSYTGAQASRGGRAVLGKWCASTSPRTVSRIEGVRVWTKLAEEGAAAPSPAFPENPTEQVYRRLDVGGEYQYRREGELHVFTPETVFLLQHATRTGQAEVFPEVPDEVDRLLARRWYPARSVRARSR